MNPAWIGVGIGVLSMLMGAFTHFMYVRVEIEKLRMMVSFHTDRLNKIDTHLPEIHEKVNMMAQTMAELKAQMRQQQ